MAKGETYEQFVDKFKPKPTTDDCYTPPEVYDVVARWAVKEYGWEDREIVRPFYPGGDYEHFDYPANCAVIDNPPFSILSKIAEFYEQRKIKYFLFAPQLTAFVRQAKSHIGVGASVIYQNGAVVGTSFICSDGPTLRSAPSLYSQIARVVESLKTTKKLPKMEYPPELVTAPGLPRTASMEWIMRRTRRPMCGGWTLKKAGAKVYSGGDTWSPADLRARLRRL